MLFLLNTISTKKLPTTIVHKPPNHCKIACQIKNSGLLIFIISVHIPLVVAKETVRKKISFISSLGNIIYKGIAPIKIRSNQVTNIDNMQDFLSNSTILNLLFDIYIETKKNTDINSNNKNGT